MFQALNQKSNLLTGNKLDDIPREKEELQAGNLGFGIRGVITLFLCPWPGMANLVLYRNSTARPAVGGPPDIGLFISRHFHIINWVEQTAACAVCLSAFGMITCVVDLPDPLPQ
jgi:hypothetical protein